MVGILESLPCAFPRAVYQLVCITRSSIIYINTMIYSLFYIISYLSVDMQPNFETGWLAGCARVKKHEQIGCVT